MSRIRATLRHRRPCMRRGVVLLLVLAALLGAPAGSASAVLLLHEHDDAGDHAHRLAAPADHGGVHVVAAWHDARHGHADDSRRASQAVGHVPPGMLIQSPASPILRPNGSEGAGQVESVAQRPELCHPDARPTPPACSAARDECLPQSTAHASGALRVLRSSHALRI